MYQPAPLQPDGTTAVVPPWFYPAAPVRDCRDARILFDAVAAMLDDAGDPQAALLMLGAGLRVARSCLAPALWQSLCADLRAHRLGTILGEDPVTALSVARPRGYAGDATLLDLVYGDPALAAALATTTPRGRLINAITMESPVHVARRECQAMLTDYVDQVASGGRPVRPRFGENVWASTLPARSRSERSVDSAVVLERLRAQDDTTRWAAAGMLLAVVV